MAKGESVLCYAKALQLAPWRTTKRSIWPSVYITGSVPGKRKEPTHSLQIYQVRVFLESSLGDNSVNVGNHFFNNKAWGRISISFYFFLSFQACSFVCVLPMANSQAATKPPTRSGFAKQVYFSVKLWIKQTTLRVWSSSWCALCKSEIMKGETPSPLISLDISLKVK